MSVRSWLPSVGVLALSLGLAACQTTGGMKSDPANTFAQITTEEAFIDSVVGKQLFYKADKANSIVIAEDRTWAGNWNGKAISGEWEFKVGYFCRTMVDAEKDCQKFELSKSQDTVKVTRNNGRGKSFIYTYE